VHHHSAGCAGHAACPHSAPGRAACMAERRCPTCKALPAPAAPAASRLPAARTRLRTGSCTQTPARLQQPRFQVPSAVLPPCAPGASGGHAQCLLLPGRGEEEAGSLTLHLGDLHFVHRYLILQRDRVPQRLLGELVVVGSTSLWIPQDLLQGRRRGWAGRCCMRRRAARGCLQAAEDAVACCGMLPLLAWCCAPKQSACPPARPPAPTGTAAARRRRPRRRPRSMRPACRGAGAAPPPGMRP